MNNNLTSCVKKTTVGETNEYSSDQIEKDIEKVKTKANTLTTLITDLMDQYDEPLRKIAKLETTLHEQQILLAEKEATIQKQETTFNEEVQKKESALKEEELKMMKIFEEREQKISNLEKKICNSSTVESTLGKNQMVKLNVGGKLFATNLVTLRSVKDTFFTGYFSEHFNPQPEEDGAYFIDRPFEQFQLILNYLRGIDMKDKLAELNMKDLKDFIEEIVFYQLIPIYEILPRNGLLHLKSKYGIVVSGFVQTPNFDRNYCSSNITIQSPTRVCKVSSTSGYGGYYDACVLGSDSVSSFTVKLISKCGNLMIGFARRNVNLNGSNYNTNIGYYVNCANGQLYPSGNVSRLGLSSMYSDGTIIECVYEDGNISFFVNGNNYGVAFTNVPFGLYPAFDVYETGCTFEFID